MPTVDVALSTQAIIRSAYAVFLSLWLISFWRQRRLFLVSEKWNGYIHSTKLNDVIAGPLGSRCILAIWTLSSLCLVVGVYPLIFLFLNVLICRYYFVELRWKSLSRGCGAPGFCCYWLGGALFLLELTSLPDTLPILRTVTVIVLRTEFAIIFLSAGFYKFFSGYRSGHGMEYGMVNPMWGYWDKFFAAIPPKNFIYSVCNHLAWGTEVVAGIMMLIPATQMWGGLLLALSFVFIGVQIRLGFLCHMVILISFLYLPPTGRFISALPSYDSFTLTNNFVFALPAEFQSVLVFLIAVYGVLLPLMYGGLWINHKFKSKLPGFSQKFLERYTNLFGMVIWRVFSSDLTYFKVRIFAESDNGETEVSRFNRSLEVIGDRYSQVTESIVCACLFTTLKYFPNNKELFIKKIFQYAKTIDFSGNWIRYQIEIVKKTDTGFLFQTAAQYRINRQTREFEEKITDGQWLIPPGGSLLTAGSQPGSYLR